MYNNIVFSKEKYFSREGKCVHYLPKTLPDVYFYRCVCLAAPFYLHNILYVETYKWFIRKTFLFRSFILELCAVVDRRKKLHLAETFYCISRDCRLQSRKNRESKNFRDIISLKSILIDETLLSILEKFLNALSKCKEYEYDLAFIFIIANYFLSKDKRQTLDRSFTLISTKVIAITGYFDSSQPGHCEPSLTKTLRFSRTKAELYIGTYLF